MEDTDRYADDSPLPTKLRGDGSGKTAPSIESKEREHGTAGTPQQDLCANPTEPQQLDILFGYTQRAKDSALAQGDDLQFLIDYGQYLANHSFELSKINGSVRVVKRSPTQYEETGDFPTDVKELETGKTLKGLRDERKRLNADVVVLVVDHPDPRNCGRAAGIGVTKEHAYVVVNWRCMATRFSFIHELGHLAGAWHDPATLARQGVAVDEMNPPYASGYVTTGPAPLATIMAYRESCPVPCGRHWFWANPFTNSDDGQVLGTVDRNYDACVWRRRLPEMVKFDGG